MDNSKKLESIFNSMFGAEKIQFDDGLSPDKVELWDSISHMELISKIEEAFGISFDAGEIASMDNVGEIKKILRKHGVDL